MTNEPRGHASDDRTAPPTTFALDALALPQATFQAAVERKALSNSFMDSVAHEVGVLKDRLRRPQLWDQRTQSGVEVEFTITDVSGKPAFPLNIHSALSQYSGSDKFDKELKIDKELSRANLEGKNDPTEFGPDFLRTLFQQLLTLSRYAEEHVHSVAPGHEIALCGIIPSYCLSDFASPSILSDGERYETLNREIMAKRGGSVDVRIAGIGAAPGVEFTVDNMTCESAPTSVQFHYSVAPKRLPDLHTAGLVALGPLMAASTNAPLLFGKQCWKESRIALLENGTTPERFIFGSQWPSSPETLFQEILDHGPLLPNMGDDTAPDMEKLPNLCIHRSTVWHWLRACYGHDEQHGPHVRTEMRVLGAGPTEIDMAANAAFYYGLTTFLMEYGESIREKTSFDAVKQSFYEAAKHGLDATLTWIDGKEYAADELIQVLIPLAEQGLVKLGIDSQDARSFLAVFEERVQRKQTGADWMIASLGNLQHEMPERSDDEHRTYLTKVMIGHQQHSRKSESGFPVARWPLASYAV